MVRMSLGDHLEEMRSRLIRALLGMLAGTALALTFGRHIQAILCRPLSVVQQKYGEPMEMMTLGPADLFLNWIKIGLLCGLILSMPWVLYQAWSFVAAGLYRHERRWVLRFAPLSVALFALGVVFLYAVVLPMTLNFFVAFNRQFTISDVPPTSWERLLLRMDSPVEPSTDEHLPVLPTVPLLKADPADPPSGAMWVNETTHRLNVQTTGGRFTSPLSPGEATPVVRSNFAIREYMAFVLSMMLAFGIAFEVPIVVVFVSLAGLASAQEIGRARRYIIFGIVIAAAILTPGPDVLSQTLLVVPMIGLFEGGLLMARTLERRRTTESTPGGAV